MSKFAIKFNNKEGSEEIVVVKTPDEVLKYITNQEIEKITVEKINDPVMNFDLVKQAITYVQTREVTENITSVTIINSTTILVADHNYKNEKGAVFQLKYYDNEWEIVDISLPDEIGPVHYGKGIKLVSDKNVLIASDIKEHFYTLDD